MGLSGNFGANIAQERKLITQIPGPKSLAMLERKKEAVSDGVGVTLPVFTVAASGGIIIDADGNSLIDLGSGIAVTSVGNAAERVVKAVQEQVEKFTHTCFMVTPYDLYVEVAEKLNQLTPGKFAKKSALFNSGAEAVENAVKVARKYTKKNAIIAFDHGYHGRTNLTMALTAKNMPYKSGFGPFASDVYRAPLSYPFRDGNKSGVEAAEKAISFIEKQVGKENLAAIIIEPVQGEGGFIVPAEGFLPTLVEWANNNGVVFIADEVQSGFARTGAMFASEHFGIEPDIIVTAKGIAGGLPLAAITGRKEIMDATHAGGLGGTYGGNPIACAAALASIETFVVDNLSDKAKNIGAIIASKFTEVQKHDSRIGEVRGLGAMMAIELVKPGTTEPDAELTSKVAKYCHDRGVVVLSCGTYGNVFRFLPPLTISNELLIEGIDVVIEALENIK